MKLVVTKEDILPEFSHIAEKDLELKHFDYRVQKIISFVDNIVYHGMNFRKSIACNTNKSSEPVSNGITHNPLQVTNDPGIKPASKRFETLGGN